MASQREIERTARRVNESTYELKSKRDSFSREVAYSDNWWKGEGSKVFKEEYQEINYEMNRTFSLMNDLDSRLRRLAYEVQRAEEERRRKLEELRMAQSAK